MMRKIIFTTAALAFTVAACGEARPPQQRTMAPMGYVGDEDCDFDDMVERDRDCGFKRKTKKPRYRNTTKANKPVGAFSKKQSAPIRLAKPKPTSSRKSSYSSRSTSRRSSGSSRRRR